MKSVIADENIIGDLIPVDLVVNGTIVAAMKTACDFTDNPRDAEDDLETGPDISFTEEGNLYKQVTLASHCWRSSRFSFVVVHFVQVFANATLCFKAGLLI